MGGQLLGKLTPLPPFPFPLLLDSRLMSFEGITHTRAGEGHWGRQPNGSSCLDALALLPYSLAPPSPCYLFIPSLGLNSAGD